MVELIINISPEEQQFLAQAIREGKMAHLKVTQLKDVEGNILAESPSLVAKSPLDRVEKKDGHEENIRPQGKGEHNRG